MLEIPKRLLSKELLPGIPPSVGLLLGSLVLDPEISLSPYFWIMLLSGFVVFTTALISFLIRKWKWKRGVWQAAGTSAAGFVLVYWGTYHSFFMGAMILLLAAALVALSGLLSRKRIRRNYGRNRRIVYAALFLCALFPLTAILSHFGQPPEVIVSPSDKFVGFARGGMMRDITLTIVSEHSNSWNVRLTARSPEMLAIYFDGIEGGPLEIPYLEQGRVLTRLLRIEASPLIMNGTYIVNVDFRYEDAFKKAYVGSTSLQVIVGYQGRPCLIATATFGSEVSPAVQFLRDFRDRLVLSTRAGSAFMEVFNAWYYSFSPLAASYIAGNAPLRVLVRAVLYPLLGVLGVSAFAYSMLSEMPELAVVVSGLVASSLIGLIYLTLPALIGIRTLVRRRKIRIKGAAKVSLALLTAALALLVVGEAAESFLILAAGSSAVVLVCLFTVPMIAAIVICRDRNHCPSRHV
jgi:hypothetical protein